MIVLFAFAFRPGVPRGANRRVDGLLNIAAPNNAARSLWAGAASSCNFFGPREGSFFVEFFCPLLE